MSVSLLVSVLPKHIIPLCVAIYGFVGLPFTRGLTRDADFVRNYTDEIQYCAIFQGFIVCPPASSILIMQRLYIGDTISYGKLTIFACIVALYVSCLMHLLSLRPYNFARSARLVIMFYKCVPIAAILIAIAAEYISVATLNS
jgi:hypothetical protein